MKPTREQIEQWQDHVDGGKDDRLFTHTQDWLTEFAELAYEAGAEKSKADYGREQKANARRIVACIHACAGISNEDLEMDNSAFIRVFRELRALKKQRFKLLTAIAAIEINADEVMEFDECVGMVVPIEDYKRLIEVAAKAKDEP